MSRARNIKPGFFKNDRLAECDPLARILFAALWCEADREGRLEDRPKRIKAECLPYDDADVDALLGQLERAGFIVRYEAAGQGYIAVVNFSKHQMPHHKEVASVIPPPPGEPAITRHAYEVSADLRMEIFERDGNRCLRCGSQEQLSLDHIVPLSKGGTNDESNLQTLCRRCNSSKGDAIKSYVDASSGQRKPNVEASMEPLAHLIPDSPSLIPDSLESPKHERVPRSATRFEDFWQAYPNRKGRKDAEAAWRRKGLDAEADVILADVHRRQQHDRDWLRGFIPHGSTYVNAEGWRDGLPPVPLPQQAAPMQPSRQMQAIQNLLRVPAHEADQSARLVPLDAGNLLGADVHPLPARIAGR